MQINTDGLIIREQSIGESDRLVTVLTREQGILRAFVRGAKAMKSRSASSTQLLCYSRLSIYEGREILKSFPLPNISVSWRWRWLRKKWRRGTFCVWC